VALDSTDPVMAHYRFAQFEEFLMNGTEQSRSPPGRGMPDVLAARLLRELGRDQAVPYPRWISPPSIGKP
jgi:hypothetical protein